MSYDIKLVHPITKKVLIFDTPHQMQGGTFCQNGTEKAHLNVTYNYSSIFKKVFGDEAVEFLIGNKLFGKGHTGIRKLYGMSGAESITILRRAISQLKDDITDNYWEVTEGNAKMALTQLLTLAKMRPDGIWDGD